MAGTTRSRGERREIAFSFGASLFLHLLMFLLFAGILAAGLRGMRTMPEPVAEQEIEITFLPPEPPKPVEEKKQEPRFVDTGSVPEAEEAPPDPVFESDKNTRAASEIPGAGTLPVPNQEGRESEFMELENRSLSLAPPAPPAPSAPAEQARQQEKARPVETPAPEPTPLPTPQPTPRSTPEPRREEIRRPPRADELALARPMEVRKAEPPAPPNVRQEVRRAEATTPARPASPGFQPERRATRITGGVDNRGPSSVAAAGTPLGKYKKALSDAIGARWYFYVSDQISLLQVGTLTLRFTVQQSGKVTGISVLRNSSNESFASVSIRSVMEADIPPIPPEVAEHLENNAIEVDYTFSIVGN